MTPSDLANVTTAADTPGRSKGGCEWLALCVTASWSTPRLGAIARAALYRASIEGSKWAGLTLDALGEADAVPRRVER